MVLVVLHSKGSGFVVTINVCFHIGHAVTNITEMQSVVSIDSARRENRDNVSVFELCGDNLPAVYESAVCAVFICVSTFAVFALDRKMVTGN